MDWAELQQQVRKCGVEKVIVLVDGPLSPNDLEGLNSLYQKKHIWLTAKLDELSNAAIASFFGHMLSNMQEHALSSTNLAILAMLQMGRIRCEKQASDDFPLAPTPLQFNEEGIDGAENYEQSQTMYTLSQNY